MCPSYMATRKERDTTRARANVLRQLLSHEEPLSALAQDEIKEVMDLCLSCKEVVKQNVLQELISRK